MKILSISTSSNIASVSISENADCILELNIDERLKKGDETLVNDIATITINGKEKHFYSFATKYCSHHFPTVFPIYDSFVEKCLIYFKKKDKFYSFSKEDLKDYAKFKDILLQFKKYYNIEIKSCRIGWFRPTFFKIVKPNFPYDEKFIGEVIEYCLSKI